MLKRLIAPLAIAASLALAAAASPLSDTGTAQVALALDSDRFRIEYVHPNSDDVAAHDHAMYHAAKLMLRMGFADFKVEGAFSQAADSDIAPAMARAFTCGTFVCSKPLSDAADFEVTAQPEQGETLIVIEIAASHVDTAAMMERVNAGRIIHRLEAPQQRPVLMAQITP